MIIQLMTMQEAQNEIIKEFKPFGSQLDKYVYLVKLGKNLPLLDLNYKTDETLIKGCNLKTWFSSAFKDGKMIYNIDSSSLLVRGAVSLLKRVLFDRTPEEIKNVDLYFINKIGITELFSPIRANSLWKITNMVKESVSANNIKNIK